MKILDWRPWYERYFEKKGARQNHSAPGPVAAWWSRRVDVALARRVAARAGVGDRPLVVSVGNLALGGTGKTPVIMQLAVDLAGLGVEGAVLTRGFRSSLSGPLLVDPADPGAGDEARLMAGRLREVGWPVIQSRRRERGLELASTLSPLPRVILLEDGHQTRAVGRHLDVLLLDAWEVAGGEDEAQVIPVTGPAFPFGPYRETAAGARRAGIWLLETSQPVPVSGPQGQRISTFTRSLSLIPASGNQREEQPRAGDCAVLSGIARPAVFEEGVIRQLGEQPGLALRLRDHQQYDPRWCGRILEAMDRAGTSHLVTTEKDWVKLAGLWPAARPVWLARLDLRWGPEYPLPRLVLESLPSTMDGAGRGE